MKGNGERGRGESRDLEEGVRKGRGTQDLGIEMEEEDVDETKTEPGRGGSRGNHPRKTCTNADKRVRIMEWKKRCQLESNFHKPNLNRIPSNHPRPPTRPLPSPFTLHTFL